MSLTKSERTSVVGIAVAALIVSALFGVQYVVREIQEYQLREEKKSLDVSVGMGEPIQLDSSVDERALKDGSSYSAALCFEGTAAVTIENARLYDSKEAIDALAGGPSWCDGRDVSYVKEYLICSVTFDNVDATPLTASTEGLSVFNAGIFNVAHGGECIWISDSIESENDRDRLNFEVSKGRSLTFDVLFGFDSVFNPDDLFLWLGTNSVRRYRCDLTVVDCRDQ